MARSRLFRLSRAAACALLLLNAAVALRAQRLAPTNARLAGEYGLYISESRDSFHVHWITAAAGSGFIEVRYQQGRLHTATTAAGLAHYAAFAKPSGSALTLTFGSRDSLTDRHSTTIYGKVDLPPLVSERVDSLYILADTHGEFAGVAKLLRSAGLIDDQLHWSGGRKQLALLGDMVDRGPDVQRLLWFLYRLEREARQREGRVHILLGNHEIMVMLGDLRYVHPKELQIAQMHQTSYATLLHPRTSVLGQWLASKPAVIRINDLLLAHGGVSGDYASQSLETLARALRKNMNEELFYRYTDTTAVIKMDSARLAEWEDFFWGERSVFWYRGYAETDTLDAELGKILRDFKAGTHVIGHTPAERIQVRYGGKLIVAHPQVPAAEMLLVTRSPAGQQFLRILPSGESQALMQ